MDTRPKIKLILSSEDKVIEFLSLLSLLGIWALVITTFSNLPEVIPTHFNGAGQADKFGPKWTILLLPIISTVLFIGITILNYFPQVLNYPIAITEENATKQYTNATKLLRYLKLVIMIIVGVVARETIRTANNNIEGLGEWFLPVTMGIFIIPVVYFLIKSFMAK